MAMFTPNKLAKLTGSPLAVAGYRNQASGVDSRRGDGARRFGGRYNSPHSFPVIYLCSSRPCVVAELTRQAERQRLPVADLLPRELWRIVVDLTKVLDLTDRVTLRGLGIKASDLVRDDLALTRDIGEAAHEQRYQAIRCASATGVDDVVAVMPENLDGAVLHAKLIDVRRTIAELRSKI